MGDTHLRSNLKAFARGLEVSGYSDVKCGTVTATVGVIGTNTVTTETITTANITNGNFTTTASVTAVGGLRAPGPDFSRGSYIKLGESCSIYWHSGIRWKTIGSIASAIASIEDIVRTQVCTPASPGPGCIFMNATKGGMGGFWVRGPNAASWGRGWANNI